MTKDVAAVGPTEALASFIATWHPDVLPERALYEAKRGVTDVLGVAMLGSTEESSQICASVVRGECSNGPCAVIGHGFSTTASLAALANGTTGHALDFDDNSMKEQAGHPSVSVAPAALAVASEIGANGHDLLEAFIVGFEGVSRMGWSGGGSSEEFYRRGLHGTSVFGIFGSTAASSRLLGLSTEQARHALGIAAAGAKGLRANFGTMAKPFQAGEANRAGVMAAKLAAKDFLANPDAIEAPLGWGDVMANGAYYPERISDGLFTHLAIEEGINFKPFPMGGGTHAPVLALIALMEEHQLLPGDIASVEVLVGPLISTYDLAKQFPWPSVAFEGKFSPAYNLAAGWVDGKVSALTYTDAKFAELSAYRDRVRFTPTDDQEWLVVKVRTVDDKEIIGSPPRRKGTSDKARPLISDEQLRQKFKDNVTVVRSLSHAEMLLSVIDRLEELTDLTELTDLLL